MALPGHDDVGAPAASVLPPWVWFWLLTYCLGLPALVAASLPAVAGLFEYRPLATEVGGTGVESLLRFASIAELIPRLAVAAGVLAVCLPWVRAAWLERRFGLGSPQPGVRAVEEIARFVHRQAPGVRFTVNLLRTDQLAFVYPVGLRRPAMALFGGIVRLWRSDRDAAEAVLLHEIGHLRQGDTFVVGVGSCFEAVVRGWFLIVLVSLVAPALVVAAHQAALFARESIALGIAPFGILTHTLVQWVTRTLPGLAAQCLALLLGAASGFLPPLAAIWLAELNADRFARDTAGRSSGLLQAIAALAARDAWWRWLLLRMSHPPASVRRVFVTYGDLTVVIVGVLLLYPLTYLARLAVLLAQNGMHLALIGVASGQALQVLARGTWTYMVTITPVVCGMAAAIVAWPMLAPIWGRVFGGLAGVARRRLVRAYIAAALSLLAGLIVGRAWL